jgi:hypothetical protein
MFRAPVIQGVPAVDGGSHGNPAPAARPNTDNHTAALRPVYRTAQFQLIPSPPQPIPVYAVGSVSHKTAASAPPVVDEGWRPVTGY